MLQCFNYQFPFLFIQFHLVITKDFVRENSWPELVPQLKAVIENSNLISGAGYSQWNTLNALTVLQAVTRPFQVCYGICLCYF